MRRVNARTLFMRLCFEVQLVHTAENNKISDLLLMLFYSSKQVATITITAQIVSHGLKYATPPDLSVAAALHFGVSRLLTIFL
jgi:hypothetical protein